MCILHWEFIRSLCYTRHGNVPLLHHGRLTRWCNTLPQTSNSDLFCMFYNWRRPCLGARCRASLNRSTTSAILKNPPPISYPEVVNLFCQSRMSVCLSVYLFHLLREWPCDSTLLLWYHTRCKGQYTTRAHSEADWEWTQSKCFGKSMHTCTTRWWSVLWDQPWQVNCLSL